MTQETTMTQLPCFWLTNELYFFLNKIIGLMRINIILIGLTIAEICTSFQINVCFKSESLPCLFRQVMFRRSTLESWMMITWSLLRNIFQKSGKWQKLKGINSRKMRYLMEILWVTVIEIDWIPFRRVLSDHF